MAVEDAYAALCGEDPEIAARLKPADRTRIARALEVVRSTGRSILDWRKERTGGIAERISLHPVILTPDRALLYERCDSRFDAMIYASALEEVRSLLARRYDERV